MTRFIRLAYVTFVAFVLGLAPALVFAAQATGIETNSNTANITLTSILVGSVLPNLIAVIVQPAWRSEIRGLVTFAICVVAGAAIAALQGTLGNVTDLGAAIVSVLVTSQVLYATLWKPSGIAPAIEAKTKRT